MCNNNQMKRKKSFSFPEKLLTQINECSSGGFILFNLDEEGIPEVHTRCDTVTNMLALQGYVNNWNTATQHLNMEMLADSMIARPPSDEEEENL